MRERVLARSGTPMKAREVNVLNRGRAAKSGQGRAVAGLRQPAWS
jgi:hypothetical protein